MEIEPIRQEQKKTEGTNISPSEVLFGLRTKERSVDDDSYPTTWLMTDEEYQQIQDGKGGE